MGKDNRTTSKNG